MKTPEEIKRGMECGNCDGCPYARWDEKTGQFADHHCEFVETDALAYIQQLEQDNARKDERIRQLEQRVPRWISVDERLPEHWHMDDKDRTLINYLVYSPDYGVDVGNYIKSAKRWVCMGLPMNVTHWMPLPEPPEEKA